MEKRETNLIKHTKYIYEYENALDDQTCDRIRNSLSEAFESNVEPDIPYMEHDARKNNAWILCGHKDNKTVSEINDFLEPFGYDMLKKYHKDCPLFDKYAFTTNKIFSKMVYRSYHKNDRYDWHTDSSNMMSLYVSILLYLNDDFEGGDTLFLNDKLRVKPKKGSLLVFPCGPYFVHKSTPIKSGHKCVIWDCYGTMSDFLVEAMSAARDK
jgi:hypothetical protein